MSSFLASFLPAFLPSLLPNVLPSFLPAFLLFLLPAFLPSFLPAFLLVCLPACLPSCLPSFLASFLPSFLPSCLPSFLPPSLSSPSFLPSCLPSFLPAFFSSVLPRKALSQPSWKLTTASPLNCRLAPTRGGGRKISKQKTQGAERSRPTPTKSQLRVPGRKQHCPWQHPASEGVAHGVTNCIPPNRNVTVHEAMWHEARPLEAL